MNLKAFLVRNKMEFTFLEKESTRNADQASRASGLPLEEIGKTLVFASPDGDPLIAVVRADQEVSRHKLSCLAHLKSVRIAPAEMAEKVTGYPTGGIPPIGHRKRLPVFLDSKLLEREYIWFGGGARTKLVRLRVKGVVGLTSSTIGHISIPRVAR